MRMPSQPRKLVALGQGAYSVATVCRILQPTMTPRKVHYWLDTGLIGEPLYWGRPGRATMLSFQQLLRIATVQRLRDDLNVTLPRVREAFRWILDHLFDQEWEELVFTRGIGRAVVVRSGEGTTAIPGAQGVLDKTLPELTSYTSQTREAWDLRLLPIPRHEKLVTNAHVLAGSPTVVGTRVETALIATFANEGVADAAAIKTVRATYPSLDEGAIIQAFEFEGFEVRVA